LIAHAPQIRHCKLELWLPRMLSMNFIVEPSISNADLKSRGTYFIGYSRNLWVIEQMLHNMFVGGKAGHHDRILDFSTAITGSTFFAPSNSLLTSLAG
jgi:deferrochelatase/peroxidase EfeB